MGQVSSACEGCFNPKDTNEKKADKNNSPKNVKDKQGKYVDLKTTTNCADDDTMSLKTMSSSTQSLNHHSRAGHKKKGLGGSPAYTKKKTGGGLESIPENENKKTTINDFQLIKVLGRGSFGKVYFVKKLSNKKYYALKTLKKDKLLEMGHAEMALTERNVLQHASHPFVVKLHYSFQNETTLYYVMDFCAGGELFTQLKLKGKFDEKTTLFYIAEVVLGLQYLHEELDIIYRDLKPENILLDANGHLKITDFGLSKATKVSNSFCGTPEYLAPEILQEKGYDRTVDWWSLGCLMYEMLTGYPPFSSNDRDKLFRDILKADVAMPALISKNAEDLLKKLLVKNPKERLGHNGADEIKKHPYFASINWDDLVNLKITAPYIPTLSRPDDLRNFDKRFLAETVAETPMAKGKLGAEANAFPSFTYVRRDVELTGGDNKLF